MKSRKPNRLQYYDYSASGYYYVTLCVNDRRCILGKIEDESCIFIKSDLGDIVEQVLLKTDKSYKNVKLGNYVIMPNHLHVIFHISFDRSDKELNQNTLSTVVRTLKTITVKKSKKCLKWQKSYYDHIIRDEDDYLRIVKYIENNPVKWKEDEYYSAGQSED